MNLFKKICKSNMGISLVELIATVAIMGLVSAGIGVAVVSASRNYSKGNSEVDVQQEVQNISNILNNLVIDSASAENSVDELGNPILIITDVNLNKYEIKRNGTLLQYTKYPADGSEADGPYDLSKYVTAFTADVTNYATDHTVHFDMAFTSAINDREMATSFTTMSRNAAAGPTVSIESAASLVIEPQAVIEPNQTIEIPFDVLTSGDATVTMTYTVSDISTSSGSYVTVDTNLNDTNKKITVHAGPNEGLKFKEDGTIETYETIYINLQIVGTKEDGSSAFTPIPKDVQVHIRRVNSFGFSGGLSSGEFAKAGSEYQVISSINATNSERFFALSSDDDYISPDRVWVTTAVSGYSAANVNIQIKNSDNSNAGSSFTAAALPYSDPEVGNYFSLEPGQYFIAKLGSANLNSGQKIEFTGYAVHASHDNAAAVGTLNTAKNKTTMKYANFEGKYTIAPSIFPTAPSGFKRGADNDIPSFYEGFPTATTQLQVFVEDFYLQYLKDHYPTDSVVIGGTAKQVNNLTVADVVGLLKDRILFSPFFSVGSHDIPDDPASGTNGYYNDGTWYWSQYRIMGGTGGSNAYHLQKPSDGDGALSYTTDGDTNPGALRLDPDKEYMLEFVSVLYNSGSDITIIPGKEVISSKSIIWPYYNKLLELGFGDKTGKNKMYDGAGYHLVPAYEDASEAGYYSYANMYPVSPADMRFRENTTFGISAGDKTIGSESNPIYMGAVSQGIYFDQVEWDGLATNAYMNRANGYLYVNKNDGSGWTLISDDMTSSAIEYAGMGYQIKAIGSEGKYAFNNVDGSAGNPNPNYLFKLVPTIRQYKYYIKDSEGIFSRTVYADSNASNGGKGYIFRYPGDTGTIYFKKYGSNAVSIILNANGGQIEGAGSTTVSIVPGTGSLPTPIRDGFYFEGWFTLPDGGSQVSQPSVAMTLYAHWINNADTYITLDANGGSVAPTKLITSGGVVTGLPTPILSGAVFQGWYTDKDNGNLVTENYAVSSLPVSDHKTTLYAHWKYKVSFDGNGGTVSATEVLLDSKNTNVVSYFPTATRSGYKFAGYYSTAIGGTQVKDYCIYSNLPSTTLYAHWNPERIIYNANGGTFAQNQPTYTDQIGDDGTLHYINANENSWYCYYTGHTFAGWYTSPTGGTRVKSGDNVSVMGGGNILYAHWE